MATTYRPFRNTALDRTNKSRARPNINLATPADLSAQLLARFQFTQKKTLLGERHQSGYCEKPRVQKVWKKASRKGAKSMNLQSLRLRACAREIPHCDFLVGFIKSSCGGVRQKSPPPQKKKRQLAQNQLANIESIFFFRLNRDLDFENPNRRPKQV